MLALFQLYDRVIGSADRGARRVAVCRERKLPYWSAQFAYESLALPLFVLALALYVRRSEGRAVACAHADACLAYGDDHRDASRTSYALAASLWILTLLSLRKAWTGGRAFGLARLRRDCGGVVISRRDGNASLSRLRVRTGRGFAQERRARHATRRSGERRIAADADRRGAHLVCRSAARDRWRALDAKAARRISALTVPPGCSSLCARLASSRSIPLRCSPGLGDCESRPGVPVHRRRAAARARARALAGPDGAPAAQPARRGDPRRHLRRCHLGLADSLLLSQPLEVRVGNAVLVPQGLSAARWAVRELPADSTYVGDEATGKELLSAARTSRSSAWATTYRRCCTRRCCRPGSARSWSTTALTCRRRPTPGQRERPSGVLLPVRERSRRRARLLPGRRAREVRDPTVSSIFDSGESSSTTCVGTRATPTVRRGRRSLAGQRDHVRAKGAC